MLVRHTGIELIDTPYPFEPTFRQIIEGDKVVVARQAVY